MALDSRPGGISPHEKPHPEDQFVALLSLLETTTHEVHILIDPLSLPPATHFLRPGLPLIHQVLKPGILHFGIILQTPYFWNLFSQRLALFRWCIGICHPGFDEDCDLWQELRLLARLVKILWADPVFEDFRDGWPGRHALLAYLKPEIGEVAGIVSQESRTNFGTIPRDHTKPENLVARPVGRDALSPESGGVLQESEESSRLLCY
ncbi:MAG TPA: hypothetical protein VNK46_11435 [Nitrospiraceae bacterium]|nr:hypothetical protein [Nitrospiraceae bacterium]